MSAPANYVLGQSTHEYERLMLQGRLLRPYTEKYFRAAGVVPGMRVLDLGSGMGDVALLGGQGGSLGRGSVKSSHGRRLRLRASGMGSVGEWWLRRQVDRAGCSRAGAPLDYGRRVGKAFTNAGLPFPTISADSVIGGARGSYVYRWIANTLISVVPRFKDLGLTLPDGMVPDQTLAATLEDAVVAAGSQILGPTQYRA